MKTVKDFMVDERVRSVITWRLDEGDDDNGFTLKQNRIGVGEELLKDVIIAVWPHVPGIFEGWFRVMVEDTSSPATHHMMVQARWAALGPVGMFAEAKWSEAPELHVMYFLDEADAVAFAMLPK